MFIGNVVDDGKPIKIDLNRLLDGRLLLQANSGGGKSYAVRKLCEVTHGKVQQIIIDPEGEFATLREKFDYVLIGKDGDLPINLRASELLARRLLELGTSAIIDIYELKHNERKRFVKQFFDSLVNAPKELWHPCLIILDEAHIFAPEASHGQAESLDSVKDLATRGRKRGFALVVATQRLSKLSKDVVAELNTKLIGRCSLDVDMKRAGYELGFTNKEDIFSLRSLEKGEFYAFGSALTPTVKKILIGKCETTHPEAGRITRKISIAPKAEIKKILAKLADLPKEADEELKTKEDLTNKITALKRELNRVLLSRTPIIDDKIMNDKILFTEKRLSNEFRAKELDYHKKINNLRYDIDAMGNALTQIQKIAIEKSELIKQLQTKTKELIENIGIGKPIQPTVVSTQIISNLMKRESQASIKIDNSGLQTITEFNEEPKPLREGAMKMLKVIAMFYPKDITKQQVGTIAGFSINGGTFNTYLSELKKNNWVKSNNDIITITEDGLKSAGSVEPLPTNPDELLSMWAGRFRQGASTMLKTIATFYPNGISKEDLAESTNFTVNTGTFNTYLSELRKNGLVVVEDNMVKASKELFP